MEKEAGDDSKRFSLKLQYVYHVAMSIVLLLLNPYPQLMLPTSLLNENRQVGSHGGVVTK